MDAVTPDDLQAVEKHLGGMIAALDRHLTAEIASLRREADSANKTAERAVEVAASEAKERLEAHNGLIEQMRQQAEINQRGQTSLSQSFATREALEASDKHQASEIARIDGVGDRLLSFQAKVVGALGVVGLIGVANLVKIWTG